MIQWGQSCAILLLVCVTAACGLVDAGTPEHRGTPVPTGGVKHYVRYAHQGNISYGLFEGETIRELAGDIFSTPVFTGKAVRCSEVKILVPVDPMKVTKVIGVVGNMAPPGKKPRKIPHPRFFAKFPTALNAHEGDVELPREAANLNFEGELAIIIGKKARHVPVEEASSYVFGVTAGNDFSENTWYGEEKRFQEPSRIVSKGADSWACLGPTIVTGVDYNDLRITVRLNGGVVARGRTKYLRNNVAELVSYISRYVTLMPGDVIYTGTVNPPVLPGKRNALRVGDVVEVEIEKIGLLRNTIIAMKSAGQNVDPQTDLIMGDGYQMVKKYCVRCHSTSRIVTIREDREGWFDIIRWMQEEKGLETLSKETETIMLDYLTTRYGTQSVLSRGD